MFPIFLDVDGVRVSLGISPHEQSVLYKPPVFMDVEGIPVTLGNVPGVQFSCAAWDTDPRRVFDPGLAMRNGTWVPEAEFRELVKSARAERAERQGMRPSG